jgi:hypothetical protein
MAADKRIAFKFSRDGKWKFLDDTPQFTCSRKICGRVYSWKSIFAISGWPGIYPARFQCVTG